MRYPVTIIAVLFSLALCLYSYSGYDPHNMFFFMLSIPAWFAEIWYDIHEVGAITLYVLTVISWAIIGFIADTLIAKGRASRTNP
ncbi:hypothetical protein ACFOQM_00490 [Paenibacillus sp. GCM10012307]|uniref:Uncharacterized protein n=1 Tax=Paenibacillus roseus TaxID=2798579 RepID=A0A934IUY7_9BACL|nr:hypothetical protein [Paenibacillus roseus]MBJ6359806.1 hypothetical protein [Paenibacillus roseus]